MVLVLNIAKLRYQRRILNPVEQLRYDGTFFFVNAI